jgi:hypothetical protein
MYSKTSAHETYSAIFSVISAKNVCDTAWKLFESLSNLLDIKLPFSSALHTFWPVAAQTTKLKLNIFRGHLEHSINSDLCFVLYWDKK